MTYLRRHPNITTDINTELTFTDFCDFITKADEFTSCSPSGRTYAHYKTLLRLNQNILHDIFNIFSLSLSKGVVLDRWCTTVTTLIEKNPGQPRIHRMRAIHIVEAELQFYSKSIYIQRMMKNAEVKNVITDEQYGGRSNRQAQSAVLNKVLYYDITRQLRTPSAFMDDDARACYDRIINPLSAVEGRKWGLPYSESILTTSIIEKQNFHIRTANGITSSHYYFDSDNPIQGAGQGLGWSGPKWTNTSDTCSQILNNHCVGMKFEDPMRSIQVNKIAHYFVDDTATGVNADAICDGTSILDTLKNTEQMHARVLFAAGHKLALDKCSYYIVDFKRHGTHFKYKTIAELPGTLDMSETFSQDFVRVPRLEPSTAHKTLGHFLAVDGNQKEHLKRILLKLET